MSDDISTVHSGAPDSYQKQCSSLRKGEYILIKDKPCEIVEISTSKDAMVHLVGLDIFDGKTYQDLYPSTENVKCLIVSRTDYQVVDIEDRFCELMLDDGSVRTDLKCGQTELISQIQQHIDRDEECHVTVLKAMGRELIIEIKTKQSRK